MLFGFRVQKEWSSFFLLTFLVAAIPMLLAGTARAQYLSIIDYHSVDDDAAQQGITSNGAHFYTSKGVWGGDKCLYRYQVDPWQWLNSQNAQFDSTVKHVGDISAGPDYIYAAVDDSNWVFPHDPQDATVMQIARFDKSLLTYQSSWDISSYCDGSAIAGVDYYHNSLYVVTYRTDEDTKILKFDLNDSTLTYSGSYEISTRAVNGIEFYGNYLYVNAGVWTDWSDGTIEVYNFDNMSTTGTNTPGGSWTYPIIPDGLSDHAEGLTFHWDDNTPINESELWVAQRTRVNRLTVPVYPDYVTWQGEAGNTNWDSFFNWDGKPTNNLSVVFDKPDSQVSVGRRVDIRGLIVRGGGFVNLELGNQTLCASQDVIVGETSGSASLYIDDGVLECPDLYIGHGASATGNLYVVGTGGTDLNVMDRLYVGNNGTGALSITNGGAVSNYGSSIGRYSGSTGEVTVDGNGSTWTCHGSWYGPLYIGDEGHGTLNITNGGAVSNYRGEIGYEVGATGVVTVDGNGSTWTNNGVLWVGLSGHGTLNITNGGAVFSNSTYYSSYIGDNFGSTGEVTVDGNGSTWTNSGSLHVGVGGQGTLNIINGGVVSNTNGYIGQYSSSTGVVTVDGSGSTWTNSGSLWVSDYGQGTLNITNGGIVEVGGTLRIRGGGTLNLTSGTLIAYSIRDAGMLNLTGGTITADSINHTYGGAFNFTGGRLNVGTFYGDLVNNGGTLAPGTSPGITHISGDYTQAADAAMEIEIGGLSAGADHDQVTIRSTANLAGTLDLSLIGEYVPDFYDEFVILTAGTLNGMFDTVTGYSVNPNMSLVVVYNADNVTIVAAIPGDVTLNGYVDGGDLDILLADWGTSVPPANYRADLSGDFFVDGDDLDIILSDWGKGVPPPVPEPASATLLLLGAVASLKRKRKSRA